MKLSGADKPILETGGSGEQKSETKPEPSNGKEVRPEVKPEPPQTDFKIAEIWIRSGQIMLDAAESFWSDRCRALGVLEFCKEIVKTAQAPKPPQNKIIPAKGSFLNGLRNLKLGRRK